MYQGIRGSEIAKLKEEDDPIVFNIYYLVNNVNRPEGFEPPILLLVKQPLLGRSITSAKSELVITLI